MNGRPAVGLRRCLNLALSALLLLAAIPVTAQEAGNGTITGRVLNTRTGRYVNNVEITVQGTPIQKFTNQFGEYEIYGLQPGEYVVEASYTGMPKQTARVLVASGQAVQQDFSIGRSAAAEGGDEMVYELEEFVVGTTDFQTMQELAIQEERFSVNLKNVVSADAYGAVAQGNIGEFVKFIPGVQIDYGGAYSSGANATQISIRGYGADQTAITIDGIPIANAQPGQMTEAIGLDMLSINNASRVEVIKVPTPDQPGASIAGTVNLISKTAFEYPKPQLSFRVYVTINSENTEFFKKTPGPTRKPTYKTIPAVDMTYALPLSDKLGFTFTLASSKAYNENHRIKPSWRTSRNTEIGEWVGADGTVISPVYADATRPVLDNLSISDNPGFSFRNSAAIKMDYRPFSGFLLTANYQYSTNEEERAERLAEMNAAGNFDLESYGPDYHIGKDGQGNSQLIVRSLDREGETHSAYLKASYIKGPWDVQAHVSFSTSDGNLFSGANGHFSEIETSMGGIEKAYFLDIVDNVPGTIRYLDENGAELDPHVLTSYNISGYDPTDPQASTLSVRAGESRSHDERTTAKFDIRRDLDFIPWDWLRVAVKTGVYREEKLKEKSGLGINYKYQYLGVSGVELELNDFLDENYLGVDPGFGFDPYEWPDPYKMYAFYLQNPEGFSDTYDVPRFTIPVIGTPSADPTENSVANNNYNEFVNTNYSIEEIETSWYWQLESNFFNNRVSVVGGVRQSTSERKGRTKYTDNNWMRLRTGQDGDGDGLLDLLQAPQGLTPVINQPMRLFEAQYFESVGATYSDGTPFRAATAYDGTPMSIRPNTVPSLSSYYYPSTEIGVTNQGHIVRGSLAQAMMQNKANFPVEEKATSRPSPMISASVDITDAIVLKLSWAQTYAKKNIEDTILRDVRYDVNATPPVANVNNPALDPWQADSYDVALSYYTDSGGKITVAYFIKQERDFWDDIDYPITLDNYAEVSEILQIDIGPEYDGWIFRTQQNGEGTAESTGYELEFSQPLGGLFGRWFEPFYFYVSYTNKERRQLNIAGGDPVGPSADELIAGGLNFNYKRFSARVNATWRSEQVRGGQLVKVLIDPTKPEGSDNYTTVSAYTLIPDELKVDVNLSYRINDKYSIDFTAKNITNTKQESYFQTVDDTYPEYARTSEARQFGVTYTLGLSGQF
jgi:TonB-dependent receptor